MAKPAKRLTVMILDERRTETFTVNALQLRLLKPTLIGLAGCCILLASTVGILGAGYLKSRHRLTEKNAETIHLQAQINDLQDARSEAITAKMAQLADSEAALAEIAAYLKARGAHIRLPAAPPTPPGTPTANAGGPEPPLPPMDAAHFDETARILLDALRQIPIGIPSGGTITSGFGIRHNPFGRPGHEHHQGIDFRGKTGDPIHATADGKVSFAGTQQGYGKVVQIRHSYGYSTLYGHLSAVDVSTGDNITAGQTIGKLGSTGRSTGPHLHYEVRRNDTPIDPAGFLHLHARHPTQ